MSEWDVVNEQIERSKIRRFNWKGILGVSLTEYILTLKRRGYTSKETMAIIMNNPRIRNRLLLSTPSIKQKMLDNIKISVCARYGEQNTARRINKDE